MIDCVESTTTVKWRDGLVSVAVTRTQGQADKFTIYVGPADVPTAARLQFNVENWDSLQRLLQYLAALRTL